MTAFQNGDDGAVDSPPDGALLWGRPVSGSALANCVTIIGIQHLKLAVISLAPVGKTALEK